MKKCLILAIISFLALPVRSSPSKKPVVSESPLDAERLQIYGKYLNAFLGTGGIPVNMANRTVPLNFSGPTDEGDCLKGIELQGLAEAGETVHLLGFDISKGRAIRMIDPRHDHVIKDPGVAIKKGESVEDAVKQGFASGVLSLSEIAFDKSHRFAVFKYSFICGRLCGQGGTLVFEKKGDEWEDANRRCSSWIS
jgi:hypothetical protein